MTRIRTVLGSVVVCHVVLTVAHGFAHLTIPVHVHGWQYGYSGVVILLLPILGTIAIFRGSITAGLWLLILSGLAAFIFEGLFHFVVASPDHVATVTSGRMLFWSTAVLTTIGDVALTVVAGWFLVQRFLESQNDAVSLTQS